MNLKEWECQLVNDHINNFDKHILEMFSPSERIGIYESLSIQFGLGGDWVNLGLTHYMQMDCKPDAGC